MISKWPTYSQEEIMKVTSLLKSGKVNYWTGSEGKKFEEEFSSWCNVDYSIAVANGTLALELALRALKIGAGDEVIVTPRSFIASVSSVINVGAKPVFAEVDINSGNLTTETISNVVTANTKAVICVHLAGWPCDMSSIMDLAEKKGFLVIEDCAQAHGALSNGKRVGSVGHIGAWSFCQDKIISTGGEGGMLTTTDKALWRRIWSYKDHGKDFNTLYGKEDNDHGFKWLHNTFGSNYRMTEIQSAIGRIQLKKISNWTKKRTKNAYALKKVCDKYPDTLITPECPKKSTHAFYRFYTYIKPKGLKKGWTRNKIINEINKLGIPCFSGSCPEIYLESAFDKTSFRPKVRLPIAKSLGETSLVFLVDPSLSDKNIDRMKKVMDKVFFQASKG